MPQARSAGAEVLVVSDGEDPDTSAAVAHRHGARLDLAARPPRGLNAARNAGIERRRAADLIVFIDDDTVDVPADWLDAYLLAGVRSSTPIAMSSGGPIQARLEGGGPRACGREPAPISTLDLGRQDRDVEFVWSANMAVPAPGAGARRSSSTRRSSYAATRRSGSAGTPARRRPASATWPTRR